MLRRVALVRTDISEELSASIITMHRLIVTANIPSSLIVTLIMEALSSSETSVLTRATRRNNPEDTILYLTRFVARVTSDYCLIRFEMFASPNDGTLTTKVL
jgi:hypothetical protein